MGVPTGVGDKMLVVTNGVMFAQSIQNTFWFGVSVASGTPDSDTIGTALFSSLNASGGFIDKLLACVPPQYSLANVTIQHVDPVRAQRQQFTSGDAGTWTEDAFNANVSGVITRRGGLANRKNIGSVHIPIAAGTGTLAGGELKTGIKTALLALATNMLTTYVVGGVTLVPILRNGPLAAQATPLTNCSVQDTARVMRRRTVRVGI